MNQRPTYEELEKRIHRLEKAESECRKTMEALRRSEERFRVLFEQANEAIFLHDLDGRFHAANLKACEYLGYSQAELLNLSVADIDPDLVQRKDPKQIWRSLPYRFEGRHLRKDGTLLPVEVSLSMIAFRDQRLILSFVTDISRRRRAEEALEESKSRYKALSEASFEAIFLSDKGTCLDQNQSAQRMFGYTHDEAVGRHGSEWIVPEDRERVIANMMSGYEKPYEVRALRKDGTTFPCEIQARMARMGGRLVRVTALRDISDRKRTEEALRENEEKYRTLFDMESDALALIELDTGRMLEVNKAFVNQYGYSRDEVLTMKNTDFSAEPEETRKATVSRGSYIPVRYHRTKDGTVFPVEISAGVFKYQGRDVHIAAIRDISERMRLEAQVQRSQKME